MKESPEPISIRFVHAADIHLDSPLRGLEAYAGAPVERLRLATRRALDAVVDLCLRERVDFLIIAGDLFDTDVKDFNAALAAAGQMRRLAQAAIPVYIILGNHDSHEETTKRVPWPDNVFVFDHKKPQSLRHPQFPVVLHGMSYSKREMNANLVPLYPDPDANVANIGLLHSSTSGNANHDVYAPCSIEELAAKGYDYWALGHIHEFAILHQHPHVVYSGNTQGRHARETGVKGCVLVTLSRSTNDQYAVTGLDFQETDVVRWFREKITLEPDDDDERLLDKTRTHLRSLIANADGRLAAVRLEYEGRCEAHRLLAQDASRQQIIATIRSLAADFGDDVWIEKIRFQTQSPLDLDALRERQDLIGDLLRDIQVKMTDPSELTSLSDVQELFTKVNAELAYEQTGSDVMALDDVSRFSAWVKQAESLLLGHLMEEHS